MRLQPRTKLALGFGLVAMAAVLAWRAVSLADDMPPIPPAQPLVPIAPPTNAEPMPEPERPVSTPLAAPLVVPEPAPPLPEEPRRHAPAEGPRGTLGVAWSFTGRGPEVEAITAGSPAAKAGLQVKDVVVEVDGSAVVNIEQATKGMLRGAGPVARLKVQRGKEFLLIDVAREWEQ